MRPSIEQRDEQQTSRPAQMAVQGCSAISTSPSSQLPLSLDDPSHNPPPPLNRGNIDIRTGKVSHCSPLLVGLVPRAMITTLATTPPIVPMPWRERTRGGAAETVRHPSGCPSAEDAVSSRRTARLYGPTGEFIDRFGPRGQ